MAQKLYEESNIQAIANAIRSKLGISSKMRTSEMASKINTISGGGSSTGVDTSDATATAADIISGKTAYADGKKITGSIKSQAAQTITPGTSDKTIPSGKYLSGTQIIKGDANLLPENIVSGKSIFGVSGTHTCGQGIDTSDANAKADNIEAGRTAYVKGKK